MALVIILAILVLIFVMAVAFLNSVSTERTASAYYVSSVTTRQLGDIAVNLVQAQIQHASTEQEGDNPVTWTSQPGLIRTFNQDGSLRLAYKLYSDHSMTVTQIDPQAIVNDLNNWQSDTAHFTDLNAPVGVDRNGDGNITLDELVYPIVDPAGITQSGGKSPIIDGFSVANAPGATSNQPVPMPVRWLYVLQDGTLARATGSGKTAMVEGATRENPIVGRIAFWTDDESCKLNINTAAHGNPWDIPRVMAEDEIIPFAKNQPTIFEFQRFPGHPAMTSLAPVLGYLYGVDPRASDPYQNLTGNNERQFAEFVYSITPRIQPGGSQFGTVVATQPVNLDEDRLYASLDELIFNPNRRVQGQGGKKIERETLEAAKFFLTAHSRAPELNLFQRPRVSLWPINNGENGKFPSSMDRLIAFCSTINDIPYYFQRSEPDDPSADIGIQENQNLKNYIRQAFSKPFPSFGSKSFYNKYGQQESDQIITQILDYIRASNIMSVTDYGATKFSTDVTGNNHKSTDLIGTRGGQVSPVIDGNTKGFGRIPTISRAVLHFYVSDIKDPNNGNASLVAKRPIPSSGKDWNSYLPPKANVVPVSFPNGGIPGSNYELETTAVLYFDFFDPMAGYPVSNYNFDLVVEFSGSWTVSSDAHSTPQKLGFETIQGGKVRIPMRYDGYHGYDFKMSTPVTGPEPRARGANMGYRLGGGRSVLSSLRGFLGFSRDFRDNINNITGNPPADGLTDFYPLVSNPVRLHRTMQTTSLSSGSTAVKFADAPKLAPAPAVAGAAEFQDKFYFDGGTAIVKLVVNKTGTANESDDYIIQTYRFDFPPFQKFVPAYAPNTSSSADTVEQRKQMTTDMNFDYRITGFPQTFTMANASGVQTTAVYLTQPGDIIVSLEAAYGDFRLVAGKKELTTDSGYSGGKAKGDFVPHEDYHRNISVTDIRSRHAYTFRISWPNYYGGIYGANSPTGYKHPEFGKFISGLTYGRNAQPDLPSRWRNGVPVFDSSGGSGSFLPDYDTSFTYMQDGPYLNRADEGAVIDGAISNWPWQAAQVVERGDIKTFYSPNKQMTGSGNLGSLPTGVVRGFPWQTLLFRPDPRKLHPGSEDPPDYLVMDLFWMPVVEPYAISEPLSTAGKINLNHEIFPFHYINRDTALRGLLLKEEIRAVEDNTLGSPPANDVGSYKHAGAVGTNVAQTLNSRNPIDLNETLKAINVRFGSGDVYRCEAEICTVPLIPKGQKYSPDFAYESSWWKARRATGDNMRERPYTNLVPRLTTRSNIYTVHYRVQTLGKSPGSNPAEWVEGRDQILGEYRGSTTIERFINPNLHDPNWTTADNTPNLNSYYIWRTLNTKQFAP